MMTSLFEKKRIRSRYYWSIIRPLVRRAVV